jgi:hypothetical protein
MKVTIKELTIESDSDFSHVNIDFSKGTFSTSSNTVKPIDDKLEQNKHTDVFKDAVLDLDESFEVQEDIVEKPEIPDTNRNVSVSEDMVNAEF